MEYWEPSNIKIYKWDEGTVLNNNSLIALHYNNKEKGKIIAIGYDAQSVQESDTKIYSPFKEGKVADWDESRKIITHYLLQVWKKKLFSKPKIAVCIVPDSTNAAKKAMEELMFAAGAKKVILTELPLENFILQSCKKECDIIISIGDNFR